MQNGILSQAEVVKFYGAWLPAMVAAQNSPQKGGSEVEALEVVKRLIPSDGRLLAQEFDLSMGKNRPNLFVTYEPTGFAAMQKPILVAGVHMDCVPGVTEQFTPRIEGGRLYGRGTFDNGSNVLASIGLLNFLAQRSSELQRPVTVAFTADEEASATSYGFDGLVKAGLVNPNDYAAAIFADTPWGAWNTKGVGIYSLAVKTSGVGHSGIAISAGTVALDLFGRLQRVLAEEFPDLGPYSSGSRLQANVFDFDEGDHALTKTLAGVVIKGDLRTNPAYPLDEIVAKLNEVAERYVANLESNSQVRQGDVVVDFKLHAHEEGYLIPEESQAMARKVIQGGFDRAGISSYGALQSVGGGLPGLRAFVDKGLVTIATGAGGNPSAENLGNYHAPNESVSLDEVAKGPAYLLGVIETLDRELA